MDCFKWQNKNIKFLPIYGHTSTYNLFNNNIIVFGLNEENNENELYYINLDDYIYEKIEANSKNLIIFR